jgi:hypothetical protein
VLPGAAPGRDLAGHHQQRAGHDDLFDALIASLTARAVALGSTLRPDAGHARAARTEGWIHLPVGGLDALPGPRPERPASGPAQPGPAAGG